MIPTPTPALGDKPGKTIEFLGRDFPLLSAEQSRDGLFLGAFKKCVDNMPQSGTPRDLARNAGNVHVPQPFFFVVDVAFLFQHAELSPHRRIICFVGQLCEHFTDRGAFELIKNVHDLPLAPG